MPDGYGLDDYAGLLWEEGRMSMAPQRPAGLRRLPRRARTGGAVTETRLEAWPLEPLVETGPPPEIAEFREELSFRQRVGRAAR